MTHLAETADNRKNVLVDKLSTQYSLSRISLEEYERLVKYSQNIETEKELAILEKIIEEYNNPPEYQKPNSYEESTNIDTSFKNHFSVLSTRKTTGPITSGNFFNILSTHKIVINEDDLINNKTVLNFMSLLGDVTIHVHESVAVINQAVPIIGGIRIDDRLEKKSSIKKLIITGNVILGDINIKVKKS